MHEVEFDEKQISGCEDKILELMISLEAEEKSLKAAEIELKAEAGEGEKEKVEARQRTAEDEKQLKELGEKRNLLRSGVGDTSLAHYDRVMRQRKSAIAEARDHKCTACFVMIRPQTWQEIRTNEQIITCSSCGRIFYYDPAHETPAEPPNKRKTRPREPASAGQSPAEATTEPTPAQ